MAKEYYSIKNQRIEFDNEKFTMTVTMHDDKFTVVSVNTLNEVEYNSQYYRFKADMFSSRIVKNSEVPLTQLTQQEIQRVENTPKETSFQDYNNMKNTALGILNSLANIPISNN